jgi:hypothetical protein
MKFKPLLDRWKKDIAPKKTLDAKGGRAAANGAAKGCPSG